MTETPPTTEPANSTASLIVMAVTLALLGVFIFFVLRGGVFGTPASSITVGTPMAPLDGGAPVEGESIPIPTQPAAPADG